MAERFRKSRVEDHLQRVLCDLMSRRMQDPRFGMATVTRVEMSDDLRHASAYVSIVGDEEDIRRDLRILRRASGWLRREVARAIQLRNVPEIRYVLDETLSAQARIEELLTEAPAEAGDDRPEQ